MALALELAGSALAASFMNCLDDTSRIGFITDEVIPDELPPDGDRESSSVAMRRKKSRPP